MLSAAEKKSAQVYRWLLAYIDENKFSGNQRLPSENALCRKLGVSRETIRVAIDQLVAEGLVYKLKGSGTYFHREKVMTRDLNTDDALYKIGLILQGQDTSANSGLIEGVRSGELDLALAWETGERTPYMERLGAVAQCWIGAPDAPLFPSAQALPLVMLVAEQFLS